MPQIQRDSLLTLEAYSRSRDSFRKKVMAHKKHRRVPLGDHVMLIFEDELTIRYQVQEMLRAEKIFEEEEIRHELETYNPLIPDGRNWKATMMIEYPDVEERKRALATLKGIEDRAYVQVEGSPRAYAIADEDLERENDEKTSAVHFLRFELTEDMAKALKYGVSLAIGVDHPNYRASIDPVSPDVRDALVADLA
jgi:Protein of unknown function (DUF3501)